MSGNETIWKDMRSFGVLLFGLCNRAGEFIDFVMSFIDEVIRER